MPNADEAKAPHVPASAQWSVVQIERLIAANGSRRETEADCEQIKGEWSEQKKQREERETSLLDAIDAAESKHGAERWTLDTSKAIGGLNDDYRRAVEQFEIIDRKKRRTEDQLKKLTERVLSILTEYEDGQGDLFTGNTAPPADEDAWLKVPLADIVGEMIARPFGEMEIFTLAEFLGANEETGTFKNAIARGDLKQAYLDYTKAKVGEYAERRGKDIGFKHKKAEMPELDKAKPAAAEIDEGDNSDEAAGSTDGTVDLGGDTNIAPEETDAGLDETPTAWLPDAACFGKERARSWVTLGLAYFKSPQLVPDRGFSEAIRSLTDAGRGTVDKFLFDMLDTFEIRQAEKIRARMSLVPDEPLRVYICEVIGHGLYAFGTPEVFDITDRLQAMCQPAWDEFTAGTWLATVAAFPATHRFGRALEPVQVGPDGKRKKSKKSEDPPYAQEWEEAKKSSGADRTTGREPRRERPAGATPKADAASAKPSGKGRAGSGSPKAPKPGRGHPRANGAVCKKAGAKKGVRR